jgi:hypothetical protein
MEFKNLDSNILDMLGEDRKRLGSIRPFKKSRIYKAFSDIPDENITAAINSLSAEGLLIVHEDSQKLTLTPKGVAKLNSLHSCSMDFIK